MAEEGADHWPGGGGGGSAPRPRGGVAQAAGEAQHLLRRGWQQQPQVDEDQAGGMDPPDTPRDPPPAATWRACLMREPLLLLTLIGVVAGVLVGAALRPAHLSEQAVELVGFPGELMLRLLRLLVLPLVSVSMVSGVCSLRGGGGSGGADGSSGGGDAGGKGGSDAPPPGRQQQQQQQQQQQHGVGRLARLTVAWYVGSTVLAILVGLALVVAVRPGRGSPFDHLAGAGAAAARGGAAGCQRAPQQQQTAKQQRQSGGAQQQLPPQQEQQEGIGGGGGGTSEALLGVARQVVPDNLVAAAAGMNVLGIISFSLMFGIALSSLGPAADGVVRAMHVLHTAVGRMVTAALWVSPVGVGSLICSSILKACDLTGTLASLGLWVGTVLAGLAVFAFAVLPALLWGVAGLSPLAVARHFAQALLMAFGTSSSAAALPLAMQAAKDWGCAEGTVNFFLPLGVTVNMSGTALYEAVTAVFIAQAHGVHLGAAQLLVVAATASLAAVGAPAIPSAGLVTMLIVLQAIGLQRYAADLAVILAVDWLLDRVRTAVNLLGDVMGVVLVHHLLTGGSGGGGGRDGGGPGSSGLRSPQIPYVQLGEMHDREGEGMP